MRTVLVCSLAVALVGVGAPQAVAGSGKYTATATGASASWVADAPGERVVTTVRFGSYGESYDEESYDGVSVRLTIARYVCSPTCDLVERYESAGTDSGSVTYDKRFKELHYAAVTEDDITVEATFDGTRLLAKDSSNGGRCPRNKIETFEWTSGVTATIDGDPMHQADDAEHEGWRNTHLAYPC